MSDIEFHDDIQAIKSELSKADRLALKRFKQLGRVIAADFERERQAQLTECIKKQEVFRLELIADAVGAKVQAAIEADREKIRKDAAEYTAQLKATYHKACEDEFKFRADTLAAIKKIEKSMERSRLSDERILLLNRGVVRGRRR